MDDLKLFAKSDDQINSLVNTVCTFSEDIGIEIEVKMYLNEEKLVKLKGEDWISLMESLWKR